MQLYHNANASDVDSLQLSAMAPKGIRNGKGKATARAKLMTSAINYRLSLIRDHIKGCISDHNCRLIWIYNVCGVKDERAWDHFYDIFFLDPVMTRHISQFHLMWPHLRSRSPPFREWLAACRSFLGQMFNKTRDQMNNCRWGNPCALQDQVNHSNPQTTSSEKVKCIDQHLSWYGNDNLRAKIEAARCRQYKPGDILADRPLNWDDIIDDDDDDENWADPRAPSGWRSRPSDSNDTDDGEGEEEMQGGEKGTGKEKGTNDGMGKGKGKGKRNGGREEEEDGKW